MASVTRGHSSFEDVEVPAENLLGEEGKDSTTS